MEAYERLLKMRNTLGLTEDDLIKLLAEISVCAESIINGTSAIENNSKNCSNQEMYIHQILKGLGIPTHIKGYHYVTTAVLLCIEDITYADQITKRLYPEVARKHSTTSNRVERAIRSAIDSGWNSADVNLKEEVFSNSISTKKNKPSNSHFITAVAEYIKFDLPTKMRLGITQCF